jgi:hypothetical protein
MLCLPASRMGTLLSEIDAGQLENPSQNIEGCFPDRSRTSAGIISRKVRKHQNEKVVKHMEKHRGAALHWFQNGHPMRTVNTQHEAMLV